MPSRSTSCPTYKHIGIGSGSTVVYVVEAIAALGREVTDNMRFYSTGEQSATLITSADLKLGFMRRLGQDVELDVCFDGADEVDEHLNLIKGGGALPVAGEDRRRKREEVHLRSRLPARSRPVSAPSGSRASP